MEELLELHDAITQHRYNDALDIVEDMTNMAQKDILDTISSFVRVLLIHLIKSHVEQKMTRSWQNSLYFALDEIQKRNKRNKANGVYLNKEDFVAMIDDRFAISLRIASAEALEGKYSLREFTKLVNAEAVKAQALDYILNGYPESEE
jgi:hypothetical protein